MKKRLNMSLRLTVCAMAGALFFAGFSIPADAAPLAKAETGIDALASSSAFEFIVPAQTYTGDAIKPIDKIGDLVEGSDYTVTYENNVTVGNAKAYVTTASGESYVYSFKILPKDIAELSLSMENTYSYTGNAILPQVTLTMDNGTVLTEDDYSIQYSGNVNVGQGRIVIAAKNKNLTGSITKTFTITECSLSKCMVEPVENMAYTGSYVKPSLVVLTPEGHVLDENSYAVSYQDNTAVGTASYTISGRKNAYGTITGTFKIVPADISTAAISKISDVVRDGSAKTPPVTVKLAGKTLKIGKDYTATYSNNVNSGVATVTLTGIGNYCGTVATTFVISRANFENAFVTFEKEFLYTGKAIKPSVCVDGYDPSEYQVYYKNNINAGTATIQLRRGSQIINKYFTIKPISVSGRFYIGNLKNYKYNGKDKKQTSLTIKDEVLNRKLVKGDDYTLSYKNNKKVGIATVIIKGKGNYTGKLVRTFVIKPGKAVISKVSKKGRNITVTAKKMSGVTGFEVQVSKTPDFKKTKRAESRGRKVTVSGCSTNTTWYVRVRAYYEYEASDGAASAYYGAWSKTKAIF